MSYLYSYSNIFSLNSQKGELRLWKMIIMYITYDMNNNGVERSFYENYSDTKKEYDKIILRTDNICYKELWYENLNIEDHQ